MAGDDKTERATPKRREEARKEGNVARSMEVNSALAMLAGFGVLALWGPHMYSKMAADMVMRLEHLKPSTLTVNQAMQLFYGVLKLMVSVGWPVFAVMAIVGVLANIIQNKVKITPEVLKPRFSKINPISGLKQKFSVATLFELAKNIVKMLVVGVPASLTLWKHRVDLLSLGDAEPLTSASLAARLVLNIGLQVAGIYMTIAIADYIFQKWRHEKQMRMTKQEVKQEMRQQDIAPEMKAAQRRRQREAARKRMLSEVPNADVIITNPTHYAIALKYDAELGAPQVLAKGVDLLALRIRELGKDAGVSQVENRALARELYARVEVGTFIPGDMFAAVAEVLAYVYRSEGRSRARHDAADDAQARAGSAA